MAENGTSQSSADCLWLTVRRFADRRVVETELPCDDRLSLTVRIQLGRALKSLFSCIRASLSFHSPNKTHYAVRSRRLSSPWAARTPVGLCRCTTNLCLFLAAWGLQRAPAVWSSTCACPDLRRAQLLSGIYVISFQALFNMSPSMRFFFLLFKSRL